MSVKKIGVLTSGGDAPGMNAAIRSVARYATHEKLEVVGVIRGYEGLINGDIVNLNHRSVSGIIGLGGTILKTGRCKKFLTKEGQEQAVGTLKDNNIDGLIVIGGDGSYRGAHILASKWKVKCIGVPGTIDNDLRGTDYTIGAHTAVNTALDAIDKIRDTATSMERIFVIEVMGNESGYIALQVALSGGCEEALIPEKRYNIQNICDEIVEGNIRGKISWIIVTAEGAYKAKDLSDKIRKITDLDVREVVLGHIQRGGVPTAQDRVLAARFGAAAVDLLIKGETDKAVGIKEDEINIVGLDEACKKRLTRIGDLYRLVKILT